VDCSVDDAPSCAVLIPAFNEASTVAAVVRVALAAGIGPVVVIDDGSDDGTAEVAALAGADLLRLGENLGKGGAVAAGARSREEDVLVLLDADLIGLSADLVRDLARPIQQGVAEMTRGVFEGGRWSTTTAQRLAPQLAGQRGVLRSHLLEVPGLEDSRYGVEVAITEHAARAAWRCVDVPLPGVSQVTKEEKHGYLRGLAVRGRMYLEIVRQLLRGKRDDGTPGGA
jgi:glycosyltransferase involved in cell wall biosynthesis